MLYIKQGIEVANSIDTTKVSRTLAKPGFTMTGLYGKVRWVGKELYGVNSILSTPLPINQIKNGKEVVVTTVTWEEMVPFMRAILDAEKNNLSTHRPKDHGRPHPNLGRGLSPLDGTALARLKTGLRAANG
jgi:hypothetical protein